MKSGFIAAAVATALALVAAPEPHTLADAPSLTDQEFRSLVTSVSEPGGTFVTDNIVSNEIAMQDVLPEIERVHRGAYVGVGPEQNLTYVSALKPSIAFVVDLQRGNLLLHLMYKALIEMSSDRADFLSRLFARPRPSGVGSGTSAAAMFDAYAAVPMSERLATASQEAVFDRLTRVHGIALDQRDRQAMAKTHRALATGGPNLRGDFGRVASMPSWAPSYAEMHSQTAPDGRSRSFLGSEANFATLKSYESRNLIVPIVGDFSGDKALRAVGDYLRRRGTKVGTFYASNVEDYLFPSDAWKRFFRNLESLPLDDNATLVRTYFTHGIEGMREFVDPMRPMLAAFDRGEIKTYDDVITRSRVPQQNHDVQR
jgi:hypothetical protein